MEDRDWKSLADIDLREIKRILQLERELTFGLSTATNYFGKLQAIKRFYEKTDQDIKEAFRIDKRRWAFSYPADWFEIFTPIERNAWESIRIKGMMVLYPQYPVLNFHADFANPGLKIALELDGAAYHSKERDANRDRAMVDQGWEVYRVTGREINDLSFKDWDAIHSDCITDEDEMIHHLKHWILNTGDGVIEAIKTMHFEEPDQYERSRVGDVFMELCRQTLHNHQTF